MYRKIGKTYIIALNSVFNVQNSVLKKGDSRI